MNDVQNAVNGTAAASIGFAKYTSAPGVTGKMAKALILESYQQARASPLNSPRKLRKVYWESDPGGLPLGEQARRIVRQSFIGRMKPVRYRFGLYEYNAATRELRREGTLVRLQAQPAQVLAYLIENAGEVVSREDLHRTVWRGDTFVDFDRGLNFCISQIRSVLKDDSAEPTYIRTIPKRGYQFIAPLERIAERETDQTAAAAPRGGHGRTVALACGAVIFAALLIGAAYKLWRGEKSIQSPIVAVLRFDNETSNSDMERFSDGLTDSVVQQLVSASRDRYRVIGNAQILRLPRDQRNLDAIAASLHAAYVVLGQVQSNGGQIRILAHLIRLPDQTHIWVVRTERAIADPLGVESDVAQKIAAEFSPRVSPDAHSASSLPPASH